MAKSKPKPTEPTAPVSFEKFEAIKIWRSQIIEAPYNPRLIGDENKKALKASLKNFGLIEPLVWNRANGTLVGGHQRLALLDEQMGFKRIDPQNVINDYKLTVAAVNMSIEEEMAANIALNNPNLQGAFDFQKISKFENIDYGKAGFNVGDVDFFKQLRFEDSIQNKPVEEIIDQFESMKSEAKAAQSPDEYMARTLAAKEVKQKAQTTNKEASVYLTIILEGPGQKNKLLEHWGLDREAMYISAETLFQLIGLPDEDSTEKQDYSENERESSDED